MSFILDALKKAERDRGLRRVPTLGSVHGRPPEVSRRHWLWLAGGVVCANAIVLAMLLRVIPAAVGVTAGASSLSVARPEVAGRAETVTGSATAPRDGAPKAGAERGRPGAQPAPARNTGDRPDASPKSAASEVVTPDGARAPGSRGLPARGAPPPGADLKLEMLVYSEMPSERAAWINGQRYVEGQRVLGTLVVEHIRPNAVTLAGAGAQRLVLQP